ncbi:hypothetical protein PRIPAC_70823 [Pristionchus pacificus]|uniref:Uncharacterized protein n=1 Tax=Pristionchus pacificus TaxID=54126 RepID=A0A2A6BRK0_PRIPA|nr:hypothetical protein PRIPAC_70823 [Pristionchus pacificus]|eukprot:PDM68497.1 hypothetical protein PRIPAC_43999 [Pristionchus pacificus]
MRADSDEGSDVEGVHDECFLTGKLIEFKRYKDSSLRNESYKEFDEEYGLKRGTSQNLWRRTINGYRKFQKKKNEGELSGSGSMIPEESFLFEEELSFLRKDYDLNKGFRSISTVIDEENEGEVDCNVIDRSATKLIFPLEKPNKAKRNSFPSVKRKLSDSSRRLLQSGGYTVDGDAVSVNVKPQRVKKKKDDFIEQLIAAQDVTIKEAMEKMTESESCDAKYADLRAKLVHTLDAIPPEHRFQAQDEMFLFMSNLERKFNSSPASFIPPSVPFYTPPPFPFYTTPHPTHLSPHSGFPSFFPPNHTPPIVPTNTSVPNNTTYPSPTPSPIVDAFSSLYNHP